MTMKQYERDKHVQFVKEQLGNGASLVKVFNDLLAKGLRPAGADKIRKLAIEAYVAEVSPMVRLQVIDESTELAATHYEHLDRSLYDEILSKVLQGLHEEQRVHVFRLAAEKKRESQIRNIVDSRFISDDEVSIYLSEHYNRELRGSGGYRTYRFFVGVLAIFIFLVRAGGGEVKFWLLFLGLFIIVTSLISPRSKF